MLTYGILEVRGQITVFHVSSASGSAVSEAFLVYFHFTWKLQLPGQAGPRFKEKEKNQCSQLLPFTFASALSPTRRQ